MPMSWPLASPVMAAPLPDSSICGALAPLNSCSPSNILSELARTLADSYFATRLSLEEAAAILTLLSANAIVTELTVEVRGVATHPEDDAVLATTLSGQASVLCTRDKQLL